MNPPDFLHPIISDYMRILAPEGSYVVVGTMRQLFQAMRRRRSNSESGGQKAYVVDLEQCQKDLLLLKDLLESSAVVPVVDGTYPLSKTAEVFRVYKEEHACGKIAITTCDIAH